MRPCPAGWREVVHTETGSTTCDPWPTTGRATCSGAAAHFPGEPTCRTIGTRCGAGLYATNLPSTGRVLYVLATAGASGAGTLDSPFSRIPEAIAVATPGTVIALSKGEHFGAYTVPNEITLWGACPEETRLVASRLVPQDAVVVTSANARVRNLNIAGRIVAAQADLGGHLTLQDVLVTDAEIQGIHARGGSVTLEDVILRDMGGDIRMEYGRGLDASDGGSITGDRVVIERALEAGTFTAGMSSRLALRNSVVDDTRAQRADNGFGDAVVCSDNGAVALDAVVVSRHWGIGLFATDGCDFRAIHVVVEDAQKPAGGYSEGVIVHSGATVRLESVRISRSRAFGMLFQDGANVSIQNAMVLDVKELARGERGIGLALTGAGAVGRVSRLVVEGCRMGIQIGTTLDARFEDIWVLATASSEGGEGYRGAELTYDSSSRFDRALFRKTRDNAVFVKGENVRAVLNDVTVEQSRPRADGTFGRGMEISAGAEVEVARVSFDDQHGVGVYMDRGTLRGSDLQILRTAHSAGNENDDGRGFSFHGGSILDLTRTRITAYGSLAIFGMDVGTTARFVDLQISESTGGFQGTGGFGLDIKYGAQFYGERVAIDRSREMSIAVRGAGTLVEIHGLSVTNARRRLCAEGGTGSRCAEYPLGSAFYVSEQGAFVAEDVFVTQVDLAGVQLVDEGTVTLRRGIIQNAVIGVNTQGRARAEQVMITDVIFRNNGRDFDTRVLPLATELTRLTPGN